MKQLKQIFVILDSGSEDQPGLRRALAVAREVNAGLTLYLPERQTAVVDSPYLAPRVIGPLQETYWEERRKWLDALVADLESKGIRTKCIFDIADNWQTQVIEFIEASQCDLVMIAAHHHQWLDRLIHLHRDWYLIRRCEKPLWICKHREMAESPRFLACAALGHGNEAAAMDQDLCSTGQWLAENLGGALHLAHSLVPISAVNASLGTSVGSRPLEIDAPELEEKHADALNHLALKFNVQLSRVHFVTGPIGKTLQRIAYDISADCVVLGNVARHGLERLVLGSTVETVLDQLSMDVLIIHAD